MKKVSESGRGFRVQGWRASGRRRLTCSKDFSPASLPTALMSSSTALLACCRKKTKTDSHQKTSSSRHKSGSFSWWRMTHWVLAELLVGSSDPSLFSPADKHLGVRHHYSDEVGLRRRETQLPEEALNPTRPDPVTRAPTCKLSPCTNTCSTGTQRVYTFSIFSGAMYSPCDSLKMCFLRSMMRRVPFWEERTVTENNYN